MTTMNLASLKEKHADEFQLLVVKWNAISRWRTDGRPDRTWAYTCAENEFFKLMKRKGQL